MTITYSSTVSTAGGIPSSFVKLLKKWRGSIYKLIYTDLLVFLSLFYLIAITYRYGLSPAQREVFHRVAAYFYQYNTMIPLGFVLGFYIEQITQRRLNQFLGIPWPDPVAMAVSSLLHGQDERGRKMRRTVMRYVCLCQVMVYTMISSKVKRRFPTYSSLVAAGFMVENERKIILAIEKAFPRYQKYWIPIVWASSILTRARKEGRIHDEFSLRVLNDELNSTRQQCMTLCHFHYISMPLVYTQTVTLAVYMYFLCASIGQQWTDESTQHVINRYFPFFTVLEFFFFMGWLKVAESCICPFGEDDDDFEVNGWIDRNIRVSYLIVDEMHDSHPDLLRDQYWDRFIVNLPTVEEKVPEHSTARLGGKKQQMLERQVQQELEAETSKFSNISHQNAGLRHRDGPLNKSPHTSSSSSYGSSNETKTTSLLPSYSLLTILTTKSKSTIAPVWTASRRASRKMSESSFERFVSSAESLSIALSPEQAEEKEEPEEDENDKDFQKLVEKRRRQRMLKRQRLYKSSLDYANEMLSRHSLRPQDSKSKDPRHDSNQE